MKSSVVLLLSVAFVAAACSGSRSREAPELSGPPIVGRWAWAKMPGYENYFLDIRASESNPGRLLVSAERYCCAGYFESEREAVWTTQGLVPWKPWDDMFPLGTSLKLLWADGQEYLVPDSELSEPTPYAETVGFHRIESE